MPRWGGQAPLVLIVTDRGGDVVYRLCFWRRRGEDVVVLQKSGYRYRLFCRLMPGSELAGLGLRVGPGVADGAFDYCGIVMGGLGVDD